MSDDQIIAMYVRQEHPEILDGKFYRYRKAVLEVEEALNPLVKEIVETYLPAVQELVSTLTPSINDMVEKLIKSEDVDNE